MITFKKIFITSLAFCILIVGNVNASTLFLEPDNVEYGLGDTFGMNIRLDIDSCVNAVEGYISFPSDILRFADFSSGQSVMSLWVKQPSKEDAKNINQEGKVYFAGGMPGGYCGKIPGDPGDSNILGKIIFTVPSMTMDNDAPKQAKISFLPETTVFLNDGRGTKDQLQTKEASLIITGKQSLVKKDWEMEMNADKLKPEPFIIELNKDESVADGKYFIMFSTTDKQTGVDHYEVLEIRPGEVVGEKPKRDIVDILLRREKPAPAWKIVSLPYVLQDQDLNSVIRVKAVDKAGNERIVEYVPAVENQPSSVGKNDMYVVFGSGIGLILLIIAATWAWYRRNKKNT